MRDRGETPSRPPLTKIKDQAPPPSASPRAGPVPPTGEPESLRITAVEGAAALDTFIRVPFRIFESEPAWIPPLLLERRLHLSPKGNPYFQHARWQAWVAWRGSEAVGRISAQIDP